MTPGWRFLLSLIALCLFSGCGPRNDGATRWESFPVTLYADSSYLNVAGAEQDLKDGMAFWEAKAGKQLFNYMGVYSGGTPYSGSISSPGDISANVVMRLSPWPLSAAVAGQTDFVYTNGWMQGADVFVNGSIAVCSQNCTSGSGTSERRIVTHELGHFLGMVHVQDTSNIMNPTVMAGNTLDDLTIDENAFAALTQ